ncbi:hypothetical protein [Salinimonas sediminis]|uniref:Lipoprotein n=1 Tax=Salinimonas sediminis TaxID=2303538 RepID=A0A346NHV2_9ALTE|nr:hypothetical protein [Salinimonas sediminis]AXR05109.1 hypothetical protein D0Y50_01225 [Salinimonas sediminis]
MYKLLLCIVISLLLGGCSQQPSYEFMVSNFKDNRATFSMIAAVACEIGHNEAADEYTIQPDTPTSQALIDLADTVSVDEITYYEEKGKCTLAMPVFEHADDKVHEQFAYRYNVAEPVAYQPAQHTYEHALETVKKGNQQQVSFDMTLTPRWFFSFFYQQA